MHIWLAMAIYLNVEILEKKMLTKTIEVFLYLMGYVNYLIMLLCIHVMIICIPRTCNLGLNHNNVQPCLSRNH